MKKVINEKNKLFVKQEVEPHYVRVEPNSDEYLKVWIKEPTWLQVEQAVAAVMKLDPKTQSMDIDLNAMYRYMIDNFIEKTEPSLSAIDMLKLTPYVGSQIKEILPNPLDGLSSGDDTKNDELEMQ